MGLEDRAFVQLSYMPLYVPTNAGPIFTDLPLVEGRTQLGVAYSLAHLHQDGTLGTPFDATVCSSADGAAVIIESLVFAAEQAGLMPALRSQRDQIRASIRRRYS